MTARPASGPIITVRDAAAPDLPIIQAIYAHHVLNGLASFEEVPPDVAEIERRHREITARGLPYVVAAIDGRVSAYAYAGPYRARPAYRHTLEDSVYVDPDAVGRGLGRAALAAVIGRVTTAGYRQMIAIIGDSATLPPFACTRRSDFATRARFARSDSSSAAGSTACSCSCPWVPAIPRRQPADRQRCREKRAVQARPKFWEETPEGRKQ
jgi:phosphinothricin acetyltransferase